MIAVLSLSTAAHCAAALWRLWRERPQLAVDGRSRFTAMLSRRSLAEGSRRSTINRASGQVPQAWASLHSAVADGLLRPFPFCLFMGFIFLPSVSTAIFQVQACRGFWYADGDGAGGAGSAKHYFMRPQSVVRCAPTSEAHRALQQRMWGLAVVWPIGGIVLLALLLWTIRKPLREGHNTALVGASRFVHNDYHASFYAWELVNLCHRTVLTGWVLLIEDEQAFLRLVLALFTSLLMCFFLLALRPYRKTSDLMLAASQQLLLVFLFLGAMIVRTRAVLAEHVSLDLIYSVLGFSSENQAMYWMVGTFLCMLFIVAGTLTYQFISRYLTTLSHRFGIEPAELVNVLWGRAKKAVGREADVICLVPLFHLAHSSLLSVRSRPIRWITSVHVAKLVIAGLVAADAAQQAAADPSRPLGGLLLRVLVVWTTLASLVSFAVSWCTDSQADLRLVWLLSLIAVVPEATEFVRSLVLHDAAGSGAPSALTARGTQWLLAALVVLNACIYLLARSLHTVVGWRYRVSRADAAPSSLLLLHASLRLDLLLVLPALLGTTVGLFHVLESSSLVVGVTAGALVSYAACPSFLLLASLRLRRKALIAGVPLGAVQLAWLIAISAVILRSDDANGSSDQSANYSTNRSATGVPGVFESEGSGLTSDVFSRYYDASDLKFFYALLVAFATVLRSAQLTLAVWFLRSDVKHRKDSADILSALASELSSGRTSFSDEGSDFARVLSHGAVSCVIQVQLAPRVCISTMVRWHARCS